MPTTERQFYGQTYAEHYFRNTLNSPYTRYKNHQIAKEVVFVDIGGNVNGAIQCPSSLRYQLELQGYKYLGLDLDFAYFRPTVYLRSDNKLKTYSQIDGIVGDATTLPFANQSIECIVCADMIEHVPNPLKVLQEIRRVIRSDGRAIIVIPSMYKLDGIEYEYIAKRRCSTHHNKLALTNWLNLCQDADLTYTTRSKPLGIMSGLSYLMWLDESFIPERRSLNMPPIYSANAQLHADVKKILSYVDWEADEYYQNNPDQRSQLTNLLLNGEVEELFGYLQKIASKFANIEEIKILQDGFNRFKIDSIPKQRIQQLIETIRQLSETLPNDIFLGNSAFLVLKSR